MTTRTRLVYGFLAFFLIGSLLSVAAALAETPKTTPPAATGPAAQSGRVVGLFLGRDGNQIKVKPEGAAEPRMYALAAPGGTPDPKVAAAVKAAFSPNVVNLEWKLQAGQPVVTSFRELLRPARNGVAVGTVMGKSAPGQKMTYLEVKAVGSPYTEQFWAAWVNGQPDKSLNDAIAALEPGDKVRLTWYRDERLRVTRIQTLPKAPASAPAAH